MNKKKSEDETRRADTARSLVMTSRNTGVQQRMLGAAVLKGTGIFMSKD